MQAENRPTAFPFALNGYDAPAQTQATATRRTHSPLGGWFVHVPSSPFSRFHAMRAYYNEIDRSAAAWLRELIAEGLIAPGDVDERSIEDVEPGDLQGYGQCHFFAGIGGWSYALRLAGVPDEFPVWTGSCPCQPFSVAGLRNGESDKRHLWPEFRRLIQERGPATVFGEQVASGLGRDWLAGVRADLEELGYAVGGADLCAAGVAAPHIRQRLYWVADRRLAEDPAGVGRGGRRDGDTSRHDGQVQTAGLCTPGRVAAVGHPRLEGHAGDGYGGREPGWLHTDAAGSTAPRGDACPTCTGRGWYLERMADYWRTTCHVCGGSGRLADAENAHGRRTGGTPDCRRRIAEGNWTDSYWHECADGVYRRVPLKSALFPLADGLPGRVGLLRGAGNAIVPQIAAQFIKASLDAIEETLFRG